jgi:hypothetical protein
VIGHVEQDWSEFDGKTKFICAPIAARRRKSHSLSAHACKIRGLSYFTRRRRNKAMKQTSKPRISAAVPKKGRATGGAALAGSGKRTKSGFRILVKTRDGVDILEPHGKPTSFTIPQLERALDLVLGPKSHQPKSL